MDGTAPSIFAVNECVDIVYGYHNRFYTFNTHNAKAMHIIVALYTGQ